ncbi:hypothetical protein KSZ_56770 [Dictyobacter formicarum]|uniref:Uncharacterized protein n=1 Tax=Dictyobacter formicarum TaxID=2778368 RepID=A0ABQ3VQR8_9CHLR|nr:hypothetical protein KSZ_56770 [Dictyobacter formicarum]
MVSPSRSRKGKPPARGADSEAGTGGRKKRKLFCNGADRGTFPTRKRADFRLVFHHEKEW